METTSRKMFGPHLTLDMYECDKQKIKDEKFILNILEELPEFLGLSKLSEPIVKSFSEPTPGVTGFVVISESHVSIHTFVGEQFASVDIFSCKKFSVKKATDYLVKKFEPKKVEKNFLIRGTHYPIELRRAIQLAAREREKSSNKV